MPREELWKDSSNTVKEKENSINNNKQCVLTLSRIMQPDGTLHNMQEQESKTKLLFTTSLWKLFQGLQIREH